MSSRTGPLQRASMNTTPRADHDAPDPPARPRLPPVRPTAHARRPLRPSIADHPNSAQRRVGGQRRRATRGERDGPAETPVPSEVQATGRSGPRVIGTVAPRRSLDNPLGREIARAQRVPFRPFAGARSAPERTTASRPGRACGSAEDTLASSRKRDSAPLQGLLGIAARQRPDDTADPTPDRRRRRCPGRGQHSGQLLPAAGRAHPLPGCGALAGVRVGRDRPRQQRWR
jgi:hypothetical protein